MGILYLPEDPDLRDFPAFDFVVSELNDRVRADGAARAQLERNVIVERAVAKGIRRNAIEAAITYQVMAKSLAEKDGVIRFPNTAGVGGLPSEQMKVRGQQQVHRKPYRARAYPIVQDLIARRTDGRPRSVEPLDEFADELDRLNFGKFRLWWTQTVAELRRSDPQLSPMSAVVLAAALVEGVLTFVVKHARGVNLEVFRSADFDRDPRTWKIDDLIKSAASGAAPPSWTRRPGHARKRFAGHANASTPAACCRSILQASRTFGQTRRAMQKGPRNRSCVACSTGCRSTRLALELFSPAPRLHHQRTARWLR